jgi:glucose-1-phosphate adenylyltransferase
MQQVRVLGIILAGGKGSRLYPLTKERTKPAVPFGGKYRIIDFVLSNFVNSGIYSIYVLTQFKSQSLLQHLRDAWQFSPLLQYQYIIPVPAQMRQGDHWYKGTSDAIYQNIHLIETSQPDMVAVFGADHIYRMDVSQMIRYHRDKGAKGTIAALPMRVEDALEFGTMAIDENWQIVDFKEKVSNPPEIPGRPGWTLASMGNYLFDTDVLVGELHQDAADPNSQHDFGKDMLPEMIHEHPIFAYDFFSNVVPGELPENRGYWRDVGTIESYFEANMDLRSVKPLLNLYNYQWPLRTAEYPQGPSKFTFDEDGKRGQAINSVVAEGCILAGGEVRESIMGRRIFLDNGVMIENSIIMDDCHIGAGSKIRNAIVSKNVTIEPGTIIGYDEKSDRRKYQVSATGIVVVEGHRSRVPVSPAAI